MNLFITPLQKFPHAALPFLSAVPSLTPTPPQGSQATTALFSVSID